MEVVPKPLAPAAAQHQQPDIVRDIKLLLQARAPFIFIETSEEQRAERVVVDAARAINERIFTWSVTRGIQSWGEVATHDESMDPVEALRVIERTKSSGVFIMRGLPRHVGEDPVIDRLLVDISRMGRCSLVVIGAGLTPPPEISDVSEVIDLPLPDLMLIDGHARGIVQQLQGRGSSLCTMDAHQWTELMLTMRGLTLDQVGRLITRLALQDNKLDGSDLVVAIEEKSKLLAEDGVVELVPCPLGMEWLAGFPNFRSWVATRARAFAPDAEAFGVVPPKGVLLTGVPGCGKSFAVKALAHQWRMPLLRMDAGSLYDKFVGSTEKNLREAFRTAEALAPSILWIDEIEKAFAHTGPSATDGGLTYRLIGMFATWMQERKQPVFVAATSNDITHLPVELTRQGRFDEIFFVDLPDVEERKHLFALQLARRGRAWEQFNIAALADITNDYSGAEVEQAVSNALYAAFAAGRDVTTDDVLAEAMATRPLARMQPEKVLAIRQWGEEHARRA